MQLKRVFVFPGPRPFAWPPNLALALNLYLPALAPTCVYPKLGLHIPTLSPQFVFTGPGLRFVRTQAAKLIYPQ